MVIEEDTMEDVSPPVKKKRDRKRKPVYLQVNGETYEVQGRDAQRLTDVMKMPSEVGNPALTGKALVLNEGDNTKIIETGMKIFMLPDIDLNDPAQVSNRIVEYLQVYSDADLKPTVVGFANALGLSRHELYTIVSGKPSMSGRSFKSLNRESGALIKKMYRLLEESWENYTQNGKINPIPAIFLAKNHFGYSDKNEIVVSPGMPDTSTFDEEDIRKRYIDSD